MKNYLKTIKVLSLRKLAFIFIFGFAFLGFYHGDFIHTTTISTYWNNNLYEKCGSCNYLPLIYGLFYLWDLPLRLFLNISTPSETDHIFFLYNKLLLVLLYAGSVYLTFKIAQLLKFEQPKLPALMFALSPFAFFVIFIFSGYDIFSVFLSLIAIYLFIKKKLFWSFLVFSVALSFKFFAIVIALSMLALIDEKLIKKISLGLLILSVPVFQIFLFYKEPYFIEGVFYLFKRHSTNQNILFNPSFFVGAGFLIWLLVLQFNPKVKKIFNGQNLLLIPYLAIIFLFCYSPVSPPWIILILPYIYLLVSKYKIENIFLILESFFFVLFIIVITNIWSRNIDLSIGNNGVFEFLHNPTNLYKDFFINLNNNQLLFLISFGSFYIFFFLPIFLKIIKTRCFSNNFNVEQIIYSRFLFCVIFFIIPFILSPYLPQKNQFLNSLNSSRPVIHSHEHSQEIVISPNESICDLMNLTYDNLEFIGMRTKSNENFFLKDIKFSYYQDYNHIYIDELFFDKKTIYLRLPKLISGEVKQTQFCIHNQSNRHLDLLVQNAEKPIKQINGVSTFDDKNIPLILYYKNFQK